MFLLISMRRSLLFWKVDFNTSHVSINQKKVNSRQAVKKHFNTSHVSINLRCGWSNYPSAAISIHLMFLLIMLPTIIITIINVHFNTSHVSINQADPVHGKAGRNFNTSHVSINPTLLSAFPFLLYLKFLENTSFFKFFPSVSRT